MLLVPTAVTFVWFGVLGGAALALDAAGAPIAESVTADHATAVYAMLAELPFSTISSFLAAIVVIIFFVSSSDSASYVVDMLTSGGNPDPPVWQRVYRATAEGATAGELLYAGGEQVLKALQAGVVSIGLPFCLLLVLLCFSLAKGLASDPRFVAEPSANRGENPEERES